MHNMKKVLYQFILFTSLQYVYRLLRYVHKSNIGIVINIVLIFIMFSQNFCRTLNCNLVIWQQVEVNLFPC